MRKLILHEEYNREEIHDILSPQTKFIPSAGTWGLHGLIRVENTKDFVFINTVGTIQGDHEFDEGFTEDGLLRWQSQPRNTLRSKIIIDLINHDETANNIYFFYREKKNDEYTYMGKLKYLNHDNESGEGMEPVNFNWQLLNWPIPENIIRKLNITLEKGSDTNFNIEINKGINLTEAPQKKDKKNKEGLKKSVFKITKIHNNPESDKKRKELGDEGELSIIEYEKEKLKNCNREDLVEKIIHVSELNDSAGYDILSYDENGDQIFIEVKTTEGPVGTDFYISPGEIKFSKDNIEKYFLYRIYHFDRKEKKGLLYIKRGNVEENFNLTPMIFRVSI